MLFGCCYVSPTDTAGHTALCWVNEEDHARVMAMEDGGNIRSVFARFCALAEAIKKCVISNGSKLMWNEKLGFMGTCPSNLGTGLRASVMIVLPEFNKLMETVKDKGAIIYISRVFKSYLLLI